MAIKVRLNIINENIKKLGKNKPSFFIMPKYIKELSIMQVVEVMPYKNFKDKISIIKQFKLIKFIDLGGSLMTIKEDGIKEEEDPNYLCYMERVKLRREKSCY
ncbi:hypothetical protein J1C67_14495 [Clostridium gasigenes]|nr:hypothetical protein [Clostridium gasigenes]QSW18747.1 hypothetical protein J1C67_14495 [Clostridium gasigenes]